MNNKYTIQDKLGRGGSGITYTALDTNNNEKVAIKVLSLSKLDNWKKIELFERESKILQQLNHPSIPKYIDYFQKETADNIDFCIVQQLAPGQSLATLIKNGWQPNEIIVKEIAEKVLDILVYLQSLNPPIIHRDIKPQNIIYQPDTGELFLVDFGAVKHTYHNTVMASTVVGTYGYMAPEQFRGQALLSTDLYGLGCTLLFLFTGKSPAELPQKKLKIKFNSAVKIDSNFSRWGETSEAVTRGNLG
jgi:serine/threonine protein kinase